LSGRLPGDDGYRTWETIDLALRVGLHGLPGGQSLGGLLCDQALLLKRMTKEHARVWGQTAAGLAGGRSGPGRPLSIDQILAWADAHRAAKGRWPSQHSGPVIGVRGENWCKIASALIVGCRGLTGGTTLKRLLEEHRGPELEKRYDKLTLELILEWADAFHQAHGFWPDAMSGPVAGVWRISWHLVDKRLKHGGRGLLGGTSLARLLREQRGLSRPQRRPKLSIDQILAWADAHHAACGEWPRVARLPVTAAPGECWKQIDMALRYGRRGLAGGSSLAQLLKEHRGRTRRPLSLEMVLAWSHAHHTATGRWPHASSGAIKGVPGETWSKIDSALRVGCRGLPGGTSLSRFLRSTLFPNQKRDARPLTIEQILAWADVHYAATGQWPKSNSGVVQGAPAEKWHKLYQALKKGLRGLSPGQSLAELLAGRQAPTVARPGVAE
jgi:hypothetical protein